MFWQMPFPPFASWSLPSTDVFLATTEMLPNQANFKRIMVVYDIIPAKVPQFFSESSECYLAKIKKIFKKCDHLIAISHCTAKDLQVDCGIPEKKNIINKKTNIIKNFCVLSVNSFFSITLPPLFIS